jgi:multicomponent Na+:H+ antiporter subunit E
VNRISPYWIAIGALVWWMLAAPRWDAWIAGGVAVSVGALLHAGLGGRSGARLRLLGLLSFLPYFADQSLRGGIDVARRALSPSLPLQPGFLDYRIRLPAGPERVFFVNCISLLPGTFSAAFRDRELTVHLLASDPGGDEGRLRRLEAMVAGLFGVELEAGDPEAASARRKSGREDAEEGASP